MTRAELVNKIVKGTDIETETANTVLVKTFEIITESLKNGEEVTLRGFGTFKTRETKERVSGLSVCDGMVIPAATRPQIKFSKEVKDAVNQKR